MKTLINIALKHILARKRQSLVSLMGIVLGVAFFLAISALMQGSEKDFIKRLVDNTPHITIQDEYRNAKVQPAEKVFKNSAVEIRNVKPQTETRGIRGYEQIVSKLRETPGLKASAVLAGQALVSYAGKDVAITLNGMIPEEIKDVSTIRNYMIDGTIEDLIANPDGIVIGSELLRRLSLTKGDNISITTPTGQFRTFKILGIFRTGRADYDQHQTFVSIKRVQALFNRAHRANTIIIKVANPYESRNLAKVFENSNGYKAISWQEASEDIINALTIRNVIMYAVVSAVLIVAAFGIYNVISTVVLEKQKDIAILKSIGFQALDIQFIFLLQGILLGIVGSLVGVPFGCLLMRLLMLIKFKPPGGSEIIQLPIDWSVPQFIIATSFALLASTFAAILPARKAAKVQPVDILRGS